MSKNNKYHYLYITNYDHVRALFGENKKKSKNDRYYLSSEEEKDKYKKRLDEIKMYSAFNIHCRERGIDPDDVDFYWDKTKSFSVKVHPNATKNEITPEYIAEIIGNLKIKKIDAPIKTHKSDEIIRVILSDIHIGMETDETGYGIYEQVWNEEELFKTLDVIINEVARVARDFKEIHVIDLGDFMDGWNGQTTRGGHSLPQNMSNRKAFDVGVRFKIELYTRLQDVVSAPLVAYNVCNDNHSSDSGFIVNETVRLVIEKMTDKITVNNLQRFMAHYTYGDHCFILCHGKDERHMKFGFKLILDPQTKDKIMTYIKYYGITSKYITFEKGDLHQQMFDWTSAEDFEYNTYRALSPASSWVKHNFKLGTRGFTIMTARPHKKSKGIEPIEI